MKNRKVIALAAALLLLALMVVYGLREIERFRAGPPPEPAGASGDNRPVIRFVSNPQPAPAFTVQGLDGKPLASADWQGKVALINFWATWCPPCIAEIPDLIRLQEKYAGQLVVVGLSQDAGPVQAVKEFVRKMKMNYPGAIVGSDVEAKFGGIFGLPTSFVVDTRGRVVQKHIGLRDPALYEMEIRALLELPVDARVERFEDTGQVLLANAKNATELPGVDLSKLTPEQRKAALRRFNEQSCTCGCGLTLAQCRVNDTSCEVSRTTAEKLVAEMLSGAPSLAPEAAKP